MSKFWMIIGNLSKRCVINWLIYSFIESGSGEVAIHWGEEVAHCNKEAWRYVNGMIEDSLIDIINHSK